MRARGKSPVAFRFPTPPASMLLSHMAGRGGSKRQATAALLFEARRGVALTQREAGESLGVDASAISRWERGETLPSATNVSRLAALYGLDELDLLRRVNEAKDEEIATMNKTNEQLAGSLVRAIDEFQSLATEMRSLISHLQKVTAKD
jgi:transcriptional regulator with XRE-family HTH domain